MAELNHIALIFVLYKPSADDLKYVESFADIYNGFVMDNSPQPSYDDHVGRMTYVFNGGNHGIGYAQNVALRRIFDEPQYEYIVFFDQDSRVETDFPARIATAYEQLRAHHANLAFLGPTVVNKSNGVAYQSVFHKDHYLSDDFIERREVISSGSCISVEALKAIGLNEERLFLDLVDCEWCWRSKSMGYVNGITPVITMDHKVGNNDYYIGKYEIIISAPYRYYYQCRNYVWMLRRRYVPAQWKLAYGVKIFCRIFYFPFVVKTGRQCAKFMLKGLWAGIRGRDAKGIAV